jgi:hypothetical protein
VRPSSARLVRTAFCVSALLLAAPASADDKDDKMACIDAASKGQTLRDQHKLVDAREALRVCARKECPGAVWHACASWLADVETSLPTVVITAKDESGGDLFDVTVTLDGVPFTKKLDGSSVPVDPGPHTFHFQASAGPGVDRQVMIKQGGKDQSVAVVIPRSSGPATTTGSSPAQPAQSGASSGGATQPAASPGMGAPPGGGQGISWKTVGWVSGGVGVAGLVLGSVFGSMAMSVKGSSCNGSNVCRDGSIDDIRSKAVVSDVGFVAGGVLLAAGAALVLLAPGTHGEAALRTRIVPVVGADGSCGAVVGGRW